MDELFWVCFCLKLRTENYTSGLQGTEWKAGAGSNWTKSISANIFSFTPRPTPSQFLDSADFDVSALSPLRITWLNCVLIYKRIEILRHIGLLEANM